uniref:MARVEL domain-containing protein n=1 Tax=Fibrocapsa japonica TaxID=94617 RepID=A0A7S2V692_9STRA|eukprot:CAMPEP_0113942916 /NCGR_PEP_ID=MMETSP1339-20121228/14953_1 /TAXON_ID=94617 /ORGANISM="Fibrocapsa japonica" /LENGTH=187 /DNA_ID=CAMNT_0000947605 /DNA_START=58 /DNA_END=621 /DNA_ORIENTATION=+ /assembly_acc=CAM_ASM_000762
MDVLASMDHTKATLFGIGAHGVLTACYLICSFVVASTANAGFNAVLTGLVYAVYCVGAYQVLHKSKTALSVGFLIGFSALLIVLSLETAIYWGQLANCETVSESISQYSCSNKSGYRAVCAFASLLFILQGAMTTALVAWKDEFISDPNTASLYEDLNQPGAGLDATSDQPYTAYDGGNFSAGTADL